MATYFDIKDDLNRYPDAWCYLVWSARGGSFGAGKTYSTLKYMLDTKSKFVFLKRTNKDVNFLCAGTKKNVSYKSVDNSPFKPLNRDLKTNIRAFKIDEGYGAFYQCSNDDEPVGDPIGYLLSLSIAKDIKGFDLSECDYIIFDEFIPQRFERLTNKAEGEAILSIYMTIQRDRKQRGRKDLKLIALANASDISNPLFNILEVVNDVAVMKSQVSEIKYVKERGIVLHSLFWVVDEKKLTGLEKAMQGTKWFESNVKGGFVYNDFSNVKRHNLKYMQCIFRLNWNNHFYYCYQNNDNYYFSTSKSNKFQRSYDLTFDNDQRRFYLDYVIDLEYHTRYNKVKYENYAIYDLIINYKKFYKV